MDEVEVGHFVAYAPLKFVRRHFVIFSALPRVFNWAIDTFLSYFFWRGFKEHDKFTTISNFVDTRGVCWLKVRTKREKRPKLTSMNYKVVCGDNREIFVTITEGSLEFDLILLQL